MKSQISGRISKREKETIRALVNKKSFSSLSEFYRIAISRFLQDIEAYEKKGLLKKKALIDNLKRDGKRNAENDMEDLIQFIDDVY
jgi:Arc/MetJ-type ribon-helix-helix transcriptional regulator|tara:strand:+ start:2831 stop:3088 length:258 start_codon:yes stop_codon:yes gene_type:complete